METSGTNHLHDAGSTGFVLNIRDITDRKQIEAALERINRQKEMILESAGEGIFGINSRRMITFVNPIAALLLGQKQEEIIGEFDFNVFKYFKSDGNEF